ncbi:MAG: hypothetical protein L0Z62_21005 [Gemmataceae bacterium]|nr:hypothetical protein [Gemmataceae bacterium]
MARQSYDKSSKWLIQHHANAILYLGGARQVRRWSALQAEVVQPGKLPDGLIQATLAGEKEPHYFLLEIATYAEKRVVRQVMDGLTLSYQYLRQLPEVLVLVLHPKGRYRVERRHEVRSRLGWSALAGEWNVIELWTLSAEELLAADNVGLVPWAALAEFEGEPATLLSRCRERIEELGSVSEQNRLLAVTEVLASLRYPSQELLAILGGRRTMSEFPIIQEIVTEKLQDQILEFLKGRFEEVPAELVKLVRSVQKEKKLAQLSRYAGACPDLKAFRARLLS